MKRIILVALLFAALSVGTANAAPHTPPPPWGHASPVTYTATCREHPEFAADSPTRWRAMMLGRMHATRVAHRRYRGLTGVIITRH